eukprot:m.43508 g.43508  ORF g.43508 m.43508 type:complete len:145 (+) comp8439_c1_seq1:3995-4429(+)
MAESLTLRVETVHVDAEYAAALLVCGLKPSAEWVERGHGRPTPEPFHLLAFIFVGRRLLRLWRPPTFLPNINIHAESARLHGSPVTGKRSCLTESAARAHSFLQRGSLLGASAPCAVCNGSLVSVRERQFKIRGIGTTLHENSQ